MSAGDDVDGKQPAVGDGALAGEEQQHRRRKRRKRPLRRHGLRRWRMVMPLYLVRGSFLVTDDAAEARGAGMDPEVWSKMPDDVMWEVLLFLPAAKLFQLQSVSHKWRQELTSAHFQKRLRECHREQQQQQQERVVACVQLRPEPCKRSKSGDSSGTGNSDNSDVNDKVLEVDLSFVPRSFWSKLGHSYSVKAAAHGLVCICNDSEEHHWNAWATRAPDGERYEGGGPGRPWSNLHCVLNPLTRTRIVLPEPPFVPDRWLLPTSTSVSILSCSYPGGRWGRDRPDDVTVPQTVLFATYDLQLASATAGAGWVLSHKLVFPRCLGGCYCNWLPDGAVLDDQAYWYNREDNIVHLMPADGVQAAGGALDVPSVTLLGLDASSRNLSLLFRGNYYERSALVAHRGAIYFVADLLKHGKRDVLCGLWRLARSDVDGRMEWEGVARLERAEVARLLAAGSRSGGLERAGFELGHRVELEAYGVREFVCCHLFDVQEQWGRYGERRLLGFNLDTHKWELVYGKSQAPKDTAFELRPDHSFLSS